MLTVKQFGKGPDLVMLHGFGLHSAIMITLAEQLSEKFTINLIDLPGYGHNYHHAHPRTLTKLSELIATSINRPAVWLGWSLGGMIATNIAANNPQNVQALIPVASNLQFTRTPNWPHAVSPDIMSSFADNLSHRYDRTLRTFLALNCHQATNTRTLIRRLHQQLLSPPPRQTTLQAGLNIILTQNIHDLLNKINCPIYYLFGEQDRLVPTSLKSEINQKHPNIQIDIIPKAGHAPFLSHTNIVTEQIIRFLTCNQII